MFKVLAILLAPALLSSGESDDKQQKHIEERTIFGYTNPEGNDVIYKAEQIRKDNIKITIIGGKGITIRCQTSPSSKYPKAIGSPSIKIETNHQTYILKGANRTKNLRCYVKQKPVKKVEIKKIVKKVEVKKETKTEVLIRTLRSVGITVVYSYEICDKTYGTYHMQHNVLKLCSKNNEKDQYETVLHESMHVIQDCRTGLHNSESKAVVLQHASDKTRNWVNDQYDWGHDHEIEAESYAQGEWHWSDYTMAQQLIKTCK